MENIERATRRRLDRWEQALREALEQTQIEEEKHRLERELAELRQARDDLPTMSRETLQHLHDRLGRNPADWIAHAA